MNDNVVVNNRPHTHRKHRYQTCTTFAHFKKKTDEILFLLLSCTLHIPALHCSALPSRVTFFWYSIYSARLSKGINLLQCRFESTPPSSAITCPFKVKYAEDTKYTPLASCFQHQWSWICGCHFCSATMFCKDWKHPSHEKKSLFQSHNQTQLPSTHTPNSPTQDFKL